MTILREGDLQIRIPDAVSARKFDDAATHKLSHCMKAVDFIVELKDRVLFIEIKDPQVPDATTHASLWIQNFLTEQLDEELKYKYRDSFLYEYASGKLKKPIYYFVLVALDSLSDADLLVRTDALKRKLPTQGPSSGVWKKNIVNGCAVLNLAAWNKQFRRYPVSRVSAA